MGSFLSLHLVQVIAIAMLGITLSALAIAIRNDRQEIAALVAAKSVLSTNADYYRVRAASLLCQLQLTSDMMHDRAAHFGHAVDADGGLSTYIRVPQHAFINRLEAIDATILRKDARYGS